MTAICSTVARIRRPRIEPPQRVPRSLAAAWPARILSAGRELTFYSDLGKPGRELRDFFLGVEMTRPTRSLFGSAAFFYADGAPDKAVGTEG